MPFEETGKIEFCSGYKYQLRHDFYIQTPVNPEHPIITDLVELYPDGWLLIRKYFAWDGCSGPTIDDRTNMRACLVHDAFYYLMRMGYLPISHRKTVDYFLGSVMMRDGAFKFRCSYYTWAVDLAGEKNASTSSARKIYTAP